MSSPTVTRRFPLDRMDGLNLGLTLGVGGVLLFVVGGMVVSSLASLAVGVGAAATSGGTAQAVSNGVGTLIGAIVPLAIGLFIAAVIGSVWLLFRPSWFELSPQGVRIRWPLRRTLLPLARITAVERITSAERVSRYGFGMRIGAGGMWGAHGYRTSNQGLLHMYISRLDYAVMIHVAGDKPSMITPRDPDQFVSMLRQLVVQRGQGQVAEVLRTRASAAPGRRSADEPPCRPLPGSAGERGR